MNTPAAAPPHYMHINDILPHAHPSLQPGTLVVHFCGNTSRGLATLLAITALGGIAVPLNRRWTARQSAGMLRKLGCRLLVTDNVLADAARAVLQELEGTNGAAPGPKSVLLILGGPPGQAGDQGQRTNVSVPGTRVVAACE